MSGLSSEAAAGLFLRPSRKEREGDGPLTARLLPPPPPPPEGGQLTVARRRQRSGRRSKPVYSRISCAPLNRRDELRDNLHFVVKPRGDCRLFCCGLSSLRPAVFLGGDKFVDVA